MSYNTYGVEVEKQNGLVIGKHFDNLDDAMCVAERAVYERGCVWSCVYMPNGDIYVEYEVYLICLPLRSVSGQRNGESAAMRI